MGLLEMVRAELHGGLPRLTGTHAVVALPLRQAVLNEVLRLIPGVPPDLVIEIGSHRHVLVRYGVFHANARLAPALTTGPAPVLALELASQLVAWGLQRAPLPRFVRIAGRRVNVHLAEIPALREFAPLWRHAEQVSFDSAPGRLDVRATLHVT